MSDFQRQATQWVNPLSVWGTAEGVDVVQTVTSPNPRDTWDANEAYKTKIHKVGRFRWHLVWPNHGENLWTRWRWWPTRRNVLGIHGLYNRKTLKAEKDR